MAPTSKSKGKKRAIESVSKSACSVQLPLKKPKRAETRSCPICDEPIPLRLLAKHAELETSRVDEIIMQVGSTTAILDDLEEGPPSRRSAKKARQSFSLALQGRSSTDILDQVAKAITSIKRRRKDRNARLREMTKDEDEVPLSRHNNNNGGSSSRRRTGGGETVCPVCGTSVRGDQDVLEAHVDACLANESIHRQREQEQEAALVRARSRTASDWDDGPVNGDGAAGHVGDVRGLGFHTRNRRDRDVDDEIDIDGDDQTYGDAQFTEGDILGSTIISRANDDTEVGMEEDGEGHPQVQQKSLRELIAEGRSGRHVDHGLGGPSNSRIAEEELDPMLLKMNVAVRLARKENDRIGLISALENKVNYLEITRTSNSSATSLLCRICLDPYNEPTVSTGCWHTCCRECWLRCLGSTKLCPICKRITTATELRKVYL